MSNYEYSVVIRDHKDAANGDFSPGDTLVFITNPTYLGWSEYLNDVGEAFCSISQHDNKAMELAFKGSINKASSALNTLNLRPHMEIWRAATKVWGGWLGELDETEADTILYGYSYLSGFYDLLTPFVDKHVGDTVADLVDTYFEQARAKTNSRVHWFTKGTIENPWTDDNQDTGLVLPLYRTAYKRILVAFKELAAYSISDTNNKVIFEVTPNGIFNFWKDRDSTNISHDFVYGNGQVRSYRRVRRPILRRSKLVGVGSSPTSVLNNASADNGLEDNLGLSEEPIHLQYVKNQTELERVLATRAKRAGRVDSDMWLSFYSNTIIPYRGFESNLVLGQNVNINFDRGTSFRTEEQKIIAGQQIIYNRMRENVRLLLTDQL